MQFKKIQIHGNHLEVKVIVDGTQVFSHPFNGKKFQREITSGDYEAMLVAKAADELYSPAADAGDLTPMAGEDLEVPPKKKGKSKD